LKVKSLLNVPMSRRERRIAARKPQTISNGSGADTPAALYETGLCHMRAERYLDAQICCQQALAIDSNHAGNLHLMGLLSLQAEQHDHAVEWIARAIRQNPAPEYLLSLGTVLQQQGRYEEALKTFDKAVQLKPDDAELWRNLGNVLVDLGRRDEAILALQHALRINPRHWSAAYKSGYVLYELDRFEEALVHFDLCDELEPNRALTLHMRALTLRGLKRFEESLVDNRRAHALDPADPITCNNIGDALQSLARHEEAVEWFDKALGLNPGSVHAISNKAFSLGELYRFDEAFAIYDRLNRTGANTALTDWNSSLLHLLHGNFEAGWAGREARWTALVLPTVYPEFSQPTWLGRESIEDKTVLVRADEGLGDSIQFARYVPMMAERGARVILMVADAVYPLLSRMPGISQCLPLSAAPPSAFDMHCPMSSLPLAFRTRLDTIPSEISYLPPPAEARLRAWEDRLGPRDRLRVGLVWSGRLGHKNDHNRSTSLRAFSRLLDVDATFVSLQKDPRPDDKALLAQIDIVDLTAHLIDFSETAALVSCLDLVITVDTSVAHLSAALGRPTWILLPYVPDYRWLLDREDSPWYPTVRLFRQSKTRDYGDVLDRVRSELRSLISAK
jgi:tetratricopeptide (TPR) repeat protein